ncbi:outer membrane beta-barrel protein [Hyphomicrobium sp. LHD-15]|uniref:outer membrane protein n=1 Tax=Hyphomicrobium sp. LHD-15 TaxID=3072142 RepID=UPI00280FA9CC|nr:outer membrane beta-barrel protein [Hyphomicrobium sp. LHD-15]MDQ8699675.1 outer membrane beta-barrel protein [Hyphomicrobium sp. LHD-15]
MRFKLTLAIIANLLAAPAIAADSPARGIYAGVFGGASFSSATDVSQLGTAFFTEAEGGPLAVNATGRTDSGGGGFVGGQVGYELAYPSVVLPAFEIEGFYLDTGTRRATLQNPTNRLPEHTFDTTYPMNSAVFLANMVFSFPTSYPGVTPYIGGGIGGARVSIEGAKSLQTDPSEGNLNHFNSSTDSEAWTFAAQVKAGVRIALGRNAYVFGEYRYLYVGSVDQTFGPTVDASHVQTSAWTVRFDGTSHHLATAGIGFDF